MNQQAQIAKYLLAGNYYLMQKQRHCGALAWMLYKGNQDPVKYYSGPVVKRLRPLLKKDKKNRYTINRSMVRQLHG